MTRRMELTATKSAAFDEEAVAAVLRTFSFLTPPIRPSSEVKQEFRRHFEKTAGKPALVLGATPELVDMLNELGSPVTCLDWNANTFEAMRRLARSDWSQVSFRHGDWKAALADFADSFGCVACDGGPLFLRFPEEWRAVSAAVRGYLVPGGRWITRWVHWVPDKVPFATWMEQRIREYEARRPDLASEQEPEEFKRLTLEIRVRSLRDAATGDAGMDEAEFTRLNDEAARVLAELYPVPEMREIIEMNLLRLVRPAPGKTDLMSSASSAQASAVLAGLDFDVEVTALKFGELACDYVLAAVKR